MEPIEAIRARHSIRQFTGQKIEGEVEAQLRALAEECNREGGLSIQLCLGEGAAFDSVLARYGKFKNVDNYIALVGKKGKGFEERCGYYGEKLVLRATQLGLGSCWVAGTYSKGKTKARVNSGEKQALVIALGYPDEAGAPHTTKPLEALCKTDGPMPGWFKDGMEAARLAPTAMNQQRFHFTLAGNRVSARALAGLYTKIDLGIAKYHFEIGAGDADWSWG